jgi:restriction system protein
MQQSLTSDEIQSFDPKKKATVAAELTIGNYCFLLQESENWSRLGWSLDHGSFTEHLEEVRKARNEFMHFSPDPLGEKQLNWLEAFVRILRAVDPRP